jgi:riboflavin-specific deaminase-like protein
LVNVAMTADGKIAPGHRRFVPFGSARDREHLLELRATADAVMSGARTVDSYPVNMGAGGVKYRKRRRAAGLAEQNLRIIVSGSGTINPRAEIFRRRFSPIILLTTRRAPAARLRRLANLADDIKICGAKELDFAAALRWLRQRWNVRRLLCEGGGELNAALFRAGLVDELHLTICPRIFGGRDAPTLADGVGVDELAEGARLKLKSMKRIEGDLFLVYAVRGQSRSSKSRS